MINARVDQNSKTVYVDVSGYITNEEANSFLAKHKQMTKGLRKSQYKLVVTPSKFECENDNDIKSVCHSMSSSLVSAIVSLSNITFLHIISLLFIYIRISLKSIVGKVLFMCNFKLA